MDVEGGKTFHKVDFFKSGKVAEDDLYKYWNSIRSEAEPGRCEGWVTRKTNDKD